MAFTLNPLLNPTAWDVFYIGQAKSPGMCVVTGFKRKFGWDKKQGKGTVGTTLTFSDLPSAEGSIKIYLWEEEHFNEWDIFVNLLKYDPTKKSPEPVDIYYPSLAGLDPPITSVVTDDIGAIEHEGDQMYALTINLIEFKPAAKKNATSTPSGSSSNPSGTSKGVTPGSVPDPIADEQQREIARLLKKAAEP